MFIVLAIILFGFLIAIHELGHFFAAKKLGVRVIEFSIGMGPRLWKKQKGETLYSLKLLPFGGSCLMAGEDEEIKTQAAPEDGEYVSEAESASEPAVLDPRAFTSKSRPRRAIILAAGAFMNLLAGVIIIVIIVFARNYKDFPVGANQISYFLPGSRYESILQENDIIYSIDGSRVYYFNDFYTLTALAKIRTPKDTTINLVIIRDGKKIRYDNLDLTEKTFIMESGAAVVDYGIRFFRVDMDFGAKLKYAAYDSYNNVRSVWLSLKMLFSGSAKISDMSGPVGIVNVISDAGNETTINEKGDTVKKPLSERMQNVFSIAALIAVNLAVMNLLPIPALDGGRIFALPITFVIEKITRKRVNPKYEGYVHAAGLVLLLGLTVVILVSDIIKVVK